MTEFRQRLTKFSYRLTGYVLRLVWSELRLTGFGILAENYLIRTENDRNRTANETLRSTGSGQKLARSKFWLAGSGLELTVPDCETPDPKRACSDLNSTLKKSRIRHFNICSAFQKKFDIWVRNWHFRRILAFQKIIFALFVNPVYISICLPTNVPIPFLSTLRAFLTGTSLPRGIPCTSHIDILKIPFYLLVRW